MNPSDEEYQAIKDRMHDVLWALRNTLPQSDTKDIQSLAEQDEFRSALETLVSILSEDDIGLTPVDLQSVKWLSNALKPNDAIGMVKNLRIEVG